MTDHFADFKAFLHQREAAAIAYINGDPGLVERIAAEDLPATFFGPRGGFTEGADQVAAKYSDDAKSFAAGGESSFEILQLSASDRIAYWVGFQRATALMKGKNEPVSFNLRVTEVFRRENGEWRMVHRHADTLEAGD